MFSPPSEHSNSNPFSKVWTKVLRWADSRAFHILSSEYDLNGSRFIRNVPENKTGSFEWIYLILVFVYLT